MSKVAIVKGTDPRLMVHETLKLLNARKIVSPSAKILVKPNCICPQHPSTGITTDAQVVEGIIDFLKEADATDITIGEGGNKYTDKTFDITGMRRVAIKHGVKLVNFNNDEYETVTIPFATALHEVPISKTVLESTCIVNVPKLKMHHMAQITLSIKNLMGVIVGDRGAIMHTEIDHKLVDLASVVKPQLNVIDGIVGSEMDEERGYPIQTNVIIAGENMVATDAVGSAIMGVNPATVRHLKLAEERNLGPSNLDKIAVVGESIESTKKKYRQGFSKKRLKKYGFDYDVGEATLRPIWERISSKIQE